MILARRVDPDLGRGLGLAFTRMGLPTAAGEFVRDTVEPLAVLLTGLAPSHGDFLKGLFAKSEAPGREAWPTWVPGHRDARPGTGLLLGRREQFDRLGAALGSEPGLGAVASALARAVDPRPLAPLSLAGRELVWGSRTFLMGVVNVTPDSFSDGGRFFDAALAVAQGRALAAAGADLLDVGGESTRPGASAVGVEEELARVLPVVRGLAAACPGVPISIDTAKAKVAAEALAAGASLVNDVTALGDPELAAVAAQGQAALCLMHMQGTPRTMQADPRYGDAVDEILEALGAAVERAVAAGVARERILVDPGIGFGKTPAHNLFLLRRLADFRVLGQPVLVGTSRKSVLGHVTGGKSAPERVVATAATVAIAAATGAADVVRVHDVAECRDAARVGDAIARAADGGDLFAPRPAGARAPGAP